MMAEVALLDGRPSPVAVRTPDLALCNLAFEGCDRGFAVGELNHAISLHADVVKVEHSGIGFAAVHAWCRPEEVSKEKQVAPAQRPGITVSPPVGICSPGPRTPPGAPPMAVRAHEFAVRNFCNHSGEAIRLPHQLADLHRLGADVVELEHHGIPQAAINAGAASEDVRDVSPGDRSTLIPGLSALPAVEISTLPHVLPAAVFAPALPAVEMRHGQRPIASIATGRSQRSDLER
jgi:hypothetical protein